MSWVKAASFNGEDVFDENADEFNLLNRDWASNMKKRIKDGFVDGANAGEEDSLQVGFNLGFREGAAKTAALGRLKGIVSAVRCWYQIQHPDSPVPASVSDLLLRVNRHEDAIAESIRTALENPPPSVSSVSDSMEDLEVGQRDPDCCGGGGECGEKNCCKGGETMELDVSERQPKPCAGATDCGSAESMQGLVERCVGLVSELGLPQELIDHIQELNNM